MGSAGKLKVESSCNRRACRGLRLFHFLFQHSAPLSVPPCVSYTSHIFFVEGAAFVLSLKINLQPFHLKDALPVLASCLWRTVQAYILLCLGF